MDRPRRKSRAKGDWETMSVRSAMTLRIAVPDLISPSYFPAIAAVELGLFEEEGYDAEIELIFPVTKAYQAQADGDIDFVAGSSHAALYVYENWSGCRLLCSLSQNMYWFLVLRKDLESKRGDLNIVKGLRIAAAPGPEDGLRQMLRAVLIDPDKDLEIVPPPPSPDAGVSFGVRAAKALQMGQVDGFWANGMGARVAVEGGYGDVVIDSRRGDGPEGSTGYTFSTLVASEKMIEAKPEVVAAGVRSVVGAQRALRRDPTKARLAAAHHFPEEELNLITDLVRRDSEFYDAALTRPQIASMNSFAAEIGLLPRGSVPFEHVVATQFSNLWT